MTYLQPEPTKFIRNSLEIDDIEGSRAKKNKHLDLQTRDIMNIKDIEGSGPKFGHQVPERSPNFGQIYSYDPIDYRDVTNFQFKTKRNVNPLMPEYVYRDEQDKGPNPKYGYVKGSKPNVFPPERTQSEFKKLSLTTQDIAGCKVSTKGLGSFHTRIRRTFLTTNVTADVPGAQPSTVKRCPDTLRQTNPLNPVYQYPGRYDLKDINDGFSGSKKEIFKQGSSTFQASAHNALGINEGSKLFNASRKESGTESGNCKKTTAQKLD